MDNLNLEKITVRSYHTRVEVIHEIINRYDLDVQAFIKKFNQEHQGKINLLDFSNYTTKFKDFKENPITKKDMEVIREFQKRKIDQRIHKLRTQNYGSCYFLTQNNNKMMGPSKIPSNTPKMWRRL